MSSDDSKSYFDITEIPMAEEPNVVEEIQIGA
jgi:hypothetical protein